VAARRVVCGFAWLTLASTRAGATLLRQLAALDGGSTIVETLNTFKKAAVRCII
jgi:hypothetical protein